MFAVHRLLETNAVHSKGILGKGVGIAVIDTGIAPHPDFVKKRNRIMKYRNAAAPFNPMMTTDTAPM